MSVVYANLPGNYVNKQDGNTIPEATSTAPRVVVFGTAAKGSPNPYRVATTAQAKAEYGTIGSLIRGMFEVKRGGAQEIILYRLGGTPCTVAHIGDSAGTIGYTITTYEHDDLAGGLYSFYYDDTTNRLVVRRNSDTVVVYDNDETNPIDLFEIIVSGYRPAAGGPSVGSPSSFVDLEDATGTGIVVTAGTDGTSLSRMELYEELYKAYEHMKEYEADVYVPMDVYLDDYNTVNQGHYIGAVTPVAASSNTYPTAGKFAPGTDVDALGMVYTEEYEGQQLFWWRFATSGVTADIYPTGATVGSATATTKSDGTTLVAADFHEVNFAYQLGRALYETSVNIIDCSGCIGVLPPGSDSIIDRARWLGEAPTWTINSSTGDYYIASSGDNGKGLLGNKFMVGRSDHRSGIFGGGFIATDGKFMDSGEELVDDNNIPVDLGKYLDVVADWPVLRNSFSQAGYVASLAPYYGGFYSNMPVTMSPTNKAVTGVTLLYRQKLANLDKLAGAGYVVLRNKPNKLVIASAVAATMPNSDWKRRSTSRIVKAIIDAIRSVTERYIGNPLSPGKRSALQTEIEEVLLNSKKLGALKRYYPFEIIQTPDMIVAGEINVALVLVPAWELIRVNTTVSVAKS